MLSLCKNTMLNNRIFKTAVTSITMLQAPGIWNSFVNPLIYKTVLVFHLPEVCLEAASLNIV